MDIDDCSSRRVYVLCPKCQELNLQEAYEYPFICCNIPGITFGSGRCCRCFINIPIDIETPDFCLTCQLMNMNL